MINVIVEQEYENFEDFLHSLLNTTSNPERPLIWRGQANASWKLESSIIRLLRKQESSGLHTASHMQFSRFKKAARGRTGGESIGQEDSDEWLALGQHFGLAIPLLDWTEAPFIASFFAFATEETSQFRAVFSLDPINLTTLIGTLRSDDEKLRIVSSESHTNARIIAQHGLFSYCPFPYVIEDWLEQNALQFVRSLPSISSPIRIGNPCYVL